MLFFMSSRLPISGKPQGGGCWGLGFRGFSFRALYPGCKAVKVGFRVKDLHCDNVPCRLQLFTSGAPFQKRTRNPLFCACICGEYTGLHVI